MGIDSTNSYERIVLEDIDLHSAALTVCDNVDNVIDALELLDEVGIDWRKNGLTQRTGNVETS
jgi:hypothetical protein